LPGPVLVPVNGKAAPLNDGAAWGSGSAPEWIRTTGLILRRDALYPAELRARFSAPTVTRCRTFGKRISRVLSPRPRLRATSEADHFSWTAVARRLQQPTRDSDGAGRASSPIWPCSGWGLPAARRCRERGGLLHRRFTLACAL